MKVVLTPGEMLTSGETGIRRQLRGMANGNHHRVDLESTKLTQFENHIIGCMAELAVAKGLNLYWAGVSGIGNVDVGTENEGVEVRCRRVGGSGLDLAIRESDKSPRPYVLVHADPPTFTLVGWLYVAEAKLAGTRGPGGLLYVSPNKLHDMVELLR